MLLLKISIADTMPGCSDKWRIHSTFDVKASKINELFFSPIPNLFRLRASNKKGNFHTRTLHPFSLPKLRTISFGWCHQEIGWYKCTKHTTYLFWPRRCSRISIWISALTTIRIFLASSHSKPLCIRAKSEAASKTSCSIEEDVNSKIW